MLSNPVIVIWQDKSLLALEREVTLFKRPPRTLNQNFFSYFWKRLLLKHPSRKITNAGNNSYSNACFPSKKECRDVALEQIFFFVVLVRECHFLEQWNMLLATHIGFFPNTFTFLEIKVAFSISSHAFPKIAQCSSGVTIARTQCQVCQWGIRHSHLLLTVG